MRLSLLKSRSDDLNNLLIIADPNTTKALLCEAKKLGLVSDRNKWIILNMVIQML